jgi:hypothetical protein
MMFNYVIRKLDSGKVAWVCNENHSTFEHCLTAHLISKITGRQEFPTDRIIDGVELGSEYELEESVYPGKRFFRFD